MTTTKPTVDKPIAGGRLTGRLGPSAIVFMVVAAAAPLTVVAGTVPVGIAAGNGANFPATYVVSTVVLLLFAFGFVAMARHVKDPGAFYSFVREGLGNTMGSGAAFLALVSYTAVQLAVYGFIGSAIDSLVTSHGGPHLAWYLWALVCVAITGFLGYRDIALSGRVLGVLLVCEVLIVFALSVTITARDGGPSGHLSTAFLSPSGFFHGAPGVGLIFAIAGFIGFEATAVFRDEARDPERTIPVATYVALILIGAFYAFASWALVSAYGDAGAVTEATNNPGTMIADTAGKFLGSFGKNAVDVLLVTSLFAALLSFHNVLARYLFSLGDKGLLPRRLGASHTNHGSPHVASLIQTVSAVVLVAACALAGLDPVVQVFTWFAGVAAVGVLALMALTSVAVIVFFAARPGLVGRWAGIIAPALGTVGLAILLVMAVQNLPLLVGGSNVIATEVGAALVLAFVLGAATYTARTHLARRPEARRPKARRPEARRPEARRPEAMAQTQLPHPTTALAKDQL